MRLFLIQCCKSKRGTEELFQQCCSILDDLPPEVGRLLTKRRQYVRTKYRYKFSSKQLTALSMYDGVLYNDQVKQHIVSHLGEGFCLLIMSGGYGFLRPDEAMSEYDLDISETARIWQDVLPRVLQTYLAHQGIGEVDGIFSASGKYIELARSCRRAYGSARFRIWYLDYHGSGARSRVPKLQGELFLKLSQGQRPASIDGVPVRTE